MPVADLSPARCVPPGPVTWRAKRIGLIVGHLTGAPIRSSSLLGAYYEYADGGGTCADAWLISRTFCECEEQVGIDALAKRGYVEAVPGQMTAARRSANLIERNQWRAASYKVVLVGNLGKDPEIRRAQDGQD
jgi:hypothetical protein